MIVLELADEIVAVEINRGIDNRTFAVMGFDAVEEALHFGAYDAGSRARLAGGGGRVPLDVENRWQSNGVLRHVANEPVGLRVCRRAEIIEVVRRMQNIRGCGAAPMVAEFRIDSIRPLRCLDEDE